VKSITARAASVPRGPTQFFPSWPAVQQLDHLAGKIFGFISQNDIPSRHDRQPLGSDGRRNNCPAHCHRLENL